MPSSAFMQSAPQKPLFIPFLLLAALYLLSILFFHFAEGWSYLDAAYFTTATITTVGYGDITPKSEMGKIGSIILIFSGVSIGLYVIRNVGLLRERKIDPHVRKRLEVLRNLTLLQSGQVKKKELKAIKAKLAPKKR